MRIKFIKGPCGLGLAYAEGNEAEFPDTQAKELIDSGFAEEIKSESKDSQDTEKAENTSHKKAEKAVKK